MEAQNLTLPVEITLVDTHPVNPQHQVSSRVASQKHKPWTDMEAMVDASLDEGDMANL